MSKTSEFIENLTSKPLFWGITGTLLLGGAAYYISRDSEDKTIITEDDNQKTGSNDAETPVVTNPPIVTPDILQTATPNLSTVTATQLTYSNVVNGSILTLYKDGVSTGLTKTADGQPWTALTNNLNFTYKLIAKEGSKTDSNLSNGVQVSQTSTPNLSTVTASQLTYSNVENGSILTLYKDGVTTGLTKTADGNAWTGLTNELNATYKLLAKEGDKVDSELSNGVQINQTITSTPNLLTVTATQLTYSNVVNGSILTLYKNNVSTGLTKTADGNAWTGLTNELNATYKLLAKEGSNADSSLSNGVQYVNIVVPPAAGLTITEPDKPALYFSDGHPASYYDDNLNLPRIFTNTPHPDPDNDYVWMKNDKIKIAINLKRGGQIAWASLIDATTNLVYNGYDGGFQITMDAYQVKDGYTQNGQVSHQQSNNGGPLTSYNTTMGGDFNNHSQTLIDYKRVGDSYYVKFRPIFYVMDSEWSQIIIEVKYTLDGNSVKCEYTYHSFRTDGQYDENTFDGAACPACFIVNTLNRYQTYTGNSPFTNSSVEDGQLPIINQGGTLVGRHTTERWSCVYKNNSNQAIGIYMPTTNVSEYSNMKQMEVYTQNAPGDEFTGGFTYFDMFTTFDNIVGNRSNYTKNINAYIVVAESPQKIREKVYQIAGR